MSCNSTNSTMNIKQECTNFANINTAFDSVHSSFTITETATESMDEFIVTIFEDVKVEEETDCTDKYDDDPLVDATHPCESQLPTNTITKEEIDIWDAEHVTNSEVSFQSDPFYPGTLPEPCSSHSFSLEMYRIYF